MLKKAVVLLFVLCISALADGDREFKIGFSGLGFDYDEYDDSGEWLDGETSNLNEIYGVSLSLKDGFGTGLVGNSNYAQIKLSYMLGKTKYDGHLQSLDSGNITPYSTKSETKLFQPEIRVGDEYASENTKISMFLGAGYRNWVRDSSSDTYGYKEVYQWKYWNLGATLMTRKLGRLNTGLEISYQRAIAPEMSADIYGGLDFDLGTTSGYKIELPIRYEVDERRFIELTTGYDYWKIEKSDTKSFTYNGTAYSAHEPKSETKNKYLDISFGVRF